MINIVVPMAGLGKRFADGGYSKPKPFIDVMGKPMIERVLENLNVLGGRFILLVRDEHLIQEREVIARIVDRWGAEILPVEFLTEGVACTVLLANRWINSSDPLLIANCDQLVDVDLNLFVQDCEKRDLDGSILVFFDGEQNKKWSFAKVDSDGIVIEVKEKVPISDLATVGIYYFKEGRFFVEGGMDMILRNDRTNNEFYTCPTYNYLIARGKRIGVYEIEGSKMHGLGVPEDLAKYVEMER